MVLFAFVSTPAFGQSESLGEPSTLPGYDRYKKVAAAIPKMTSAGRITDVAWGEDESFFDFKKDGKDFHFLIETGKVVEGKNGKKAITPKNFSPRGRWDAAVGRAKQATEVVSPDKTLKAVYAENNIRIVPNGQSRGREMEVTKDGTERRRYGTACWVYGEELYQSHAMWWSLDSTKLVYYEIDESHMRDYFLTVNNAANPLKSDADLYTKLMRVRYPVAGQPNPNVALHVFDTKTMKSRKLEFDGPSDQYLYNVRFTPDGKSLLVNRTNRRQNKLDVLSVDIETGKVKTVVTESQETWQENRPMIHFLLDNRRFVWETEKTGWKHYELRDLEGRRLNKLTDHGEYAVDQILRIDDESGFVYFTAFSDLGNPLNQHLHRVKLDGSQHQKLTTGSLNHTWFSIAPSGKWFLATLESVDQPAKTILYDRDGKPLAVIAKGDTSKMAKELKLAEPELFYFTAADGKTKIYGVLHKPSNFDPSKKYPLVIDVYGGPGSRGPTNTYHPANKNCEFGFLIAKIGNRGTTHRGKAFESANYRGLGGIDIQDQADGVKFLRQKNFVDGKRVGIFGHSYGGYMSALGVLKYPEIFHVAVSGAPVTDWKNYDTIYTERYMQTPAENESGYRDGSCLNYVKNLKGKLLLVHGLVDDNVHPSNTWQLVQALHQANKRFDVQVFPNNAHRIKGPYNAIRWEYLHRHLKPTPNPKQGGSAAAIE